MKSILVLAVVVVVAAACTATETGRAKRWPTHRRERDARMEILEKQVTVLVEHVTRLQAAVAALHGVSNPHADARTDTPTPASTPGTP